MDSGVGQFCWHVMLDCTVQVDIDGSPGREVGVVSAVKQLQRNPMPPPSADWTIQFSPSGVVS